MISNNVRLQASLLAALIDHRKSHQNVTDRHRQFVSQFMNRYRRFLYIDAKKTHIQSIADDVHAFESTG